MLKKIFPRFKYAYSLMAAVLALFVLLSVCMTGTTIALTAAPTPALAEDVEIFQPADDSKLELFKARMFNGFINLESEIDVSDIGISESELVFPGISGTGRTGFIGYVRTQTSLISTYCISYSSLSFTYNANNTIATAKVSYLSTWTEAAMAAFKTSYADFINNAPTDGTDIQKALYVHDWICTRTSYSQSAKYADTALGVMTDGRALCAGFSYAYQFLAQQLGLECNYVTGQTASEAHAWNKVKIDSQWFLVDSTWDRALASPTNYSHTFFLVNDTEFKTVGGGQHGSDKDVTNNEPINTCWSFTNKYWSGVYGPVPTNQTAQDAKLEASHAWDDGTITAQATCTVPGQTTYTCTLCGATKAEDIQALGHDYVTTVTEPTCTANGYTTHTCSRCGDSYTDAEIPALGHNYQQTSYTAPTCTKEGSKTSTCTRCGDKKTEIIAKINHSYETVVTKQATCGTAGTKVTRCKACGYVFKTESIPATGKHTWDKGKVTKEATTTSTGIMTYTCMVCGKTKTETIPKKTAPATTKPATTTKPTTNTKPTTSTQPTTATIPTTSTKPTTTKPSTTKPAATTTTKVATVTMYRLYNPNSGEHFYTANWGEVSNIVAAGWRYEGKGWTAPKSSKTPVYRLYSGTDHHYTTSTSERDSLRRAGWKYEGIGWYSDDSKGVPLYRQFNPNVQPTAPRNNSGSHNYTTSKKENDQLVSVGWRAEGIGWYGVK